jgi:hypothetical protein
MNRPRELPVSTTVGDAYRLVRRLGKGAFGTVYEARHLHDERAFAVKVMNGALFDTSEAMAAFHSTAEIASRLAHPHIGQLLDFGAGATGDPYLVMELLPGEDLGRRLRRAPEGRFDPRTVGHLVKQIAGGVAAMHRQGVLHLGLKPSNVMLLSMAGEPDFVKLLDCGTAQVENARTLDHATAFQDSLPYIAPEQTGAGTQALGPGADQWALACLAWHMLVGRPPFAGDDPTALLYQVSFEDPQPIADPTLTLPPGVLEVLLHALGKRPERRFTDVTELAEVLEAATGPLPVAARPAPGSPPVAASLPGQAFADPAAAAGARSAASGPGGWLQAPRGADAVFLPGMSRREGAAPARRGGGQTRMQGLRVRSRSSHPAPAPDAGEAPAAPGPPPPDAGDPGAGAGAWATLRGQLATPTGRRWFLVGGLPALLLVAYVAGRGRSGGTRVDSERAPTPRPPGGPGAPGAPAANAGAAARTGAEIVPLAPARALVNVNKDRDRDRRRARGGKARTKPRRGGNRTP